MSKLGKILRTAWTVALCVAGVLLGGMTGYHNAGYTGAIARPGSWIIGVILGVLKGQGRRTRWVQHQGARQCGARFGRKEIGEVAIVVVFDTVEIWNALARKLHDRLQSGLSVRVMLDLVGKREVAVLANAHLASEYTRFTPAVPPARFQRAGRRMPFSAGQQIQTGADSDTVLATFRTTFWDESAIGLSMPSTRTKRWFLSPR